MNYPSRVFYHLIVLTMGILFKNKSLLLKTLTENFLTISLTFKSSNTFLHSGYAHRFPIENSAILLGESDVDFLSEMISTSLYNAPYSMRSGIKVLEFRTKLPNAPAAFALVFSSRSCNRSISNDTHGLRCLYSLSLWNPAFPTAKQANFRTFLSLALQHWIAKLIRLF